jgi:starch synthase
MGTGEDKYQIHLTEMASAHPKRIGLRIAYHKALSHRIMAGADIFLMPSRYEPCGLEQLYALRYGTIPVVRATGGLDDTVIDFKEYPENGTGFKFNEYTSEAMIEALEAAVKLFAEKTTWEKLMKRGMALDFSWEKAAARYEEIYEKAIQESNGA